MEMKVYYPFYRKFYFTIIVDRDVYWKASQILKILRLDRNVSETLFNFRIKRIGGKHKRNVSCLSVEQVKTLISKTQEKDPLHQNEQFEEWFDSVMTGGQVFYSKQLKKSSRIVATCMDLNLDGSITRTGEDIIATESGWNYCVSSNHNFDVDSPIKIRPENFIKKKYLFTIPSLFQ